MRALYLTTSLDFDMFQYFMELIPTRVLMNDLFSLSAINPFARLNMFLSSADDVPDIKDFSYQMSVTDKVTVLQ